MNAIEQALKSMRIPGCCLGFSKERGIYTFLPISKKPPKWVDFTTYSYFRDLLGENE